MKSFGTISYKTVAVLGVIALGIFALIYDSFAVRTAAASSNAESVSSRSLYNVHCASCHGRDGRSNTAKGRETEADDITGGVSTAKTIRVVTNGRGDMPGFKKKLSAAQISSIARYVATL